MRDCFTGHNLNFNLYLRVDLWREREQRFLDSTNTPTFWDYVAYDSHPQRNTVHSNKGQIVIDAHGIPIENQLH